MPKIDVYAQCDRAISALRRHRTRVDRYRSPEDRALLVIAIDREITRLEVALGDVIQLEKIFGRK